MSETEKPEAPPAVRRHLTKLGVVTSNKMTKTVVVMVESIRSHRTYGRTVRRSSTFMAHDENGICGVGDRVLISEARPLSRRKRWRVVKVVQKNAAPEMVRPVGAEGEAAG